MNLNRFIATVGGVGLMKKAPGTWGSLAGVLAALILARFPLALWGIVLLGFIGGLWVIPALIKNQTDKDPGYIVIDEFVAQLLIFACLPTSFLNPLTYLFGFAFFRLFDILKPWPASYFDQKVHTAFGIMMDDIAASVFALIGLLLIILLSF